MHCVRYFFGDFVLPRASILVVDEDPTHLRIYSWIMNAAGFSAVTAQVHSSDVSLPANDRFDVVVLDYRLTGTLTAVEAAQQIKRKYPDAPIVILSDVHGMPDDVAPSRIGLCARANRKS